MASERRDGDETNVRRGAVVRFRAAFGARVRQVRKKRFAHTARLHRLRRNPRPCRRRVSRRFRDLHRALLLTLPRRNPRPCVAHGLRCRLQPLRIPGANREGAVTQAVFHRVPFGSRTLFGVAQRGVGGRKSICKRRGNRKSRRV